MPTTDALRHFFLSPCCGERPTSHPRRRERTDLEMGEQKTCRKNHARALVRDNDLLEQSIREQEASVMKEFHRALVLHEGRNEQVQAPRMDDHLVDVMELAHNKLKLAHDLVASQQRTTLHLAKYHDGKPRAWTMLQERQLASVRQNAMDAKREVALNYPDAGQDLDRTLRCEPEARDRFLRAFHAQEEISSSNLHARNYPWAQDLALATLL